MAEVRWRFAALILAILVYTVAGHHIPGHLTDDQDEVIHTQAVHSGPGVLWTVSEADNATKIEHTHHGLSNPAEVEVSFPALSDVKISIPVQESTVNQPVIHESLTETHPDLLAVETNASEPSLAQPPVLVVEKKAINVEAKDRLPEEKIPEILGLIDKLPVPELKAGSGHNKTEKCFFSLFSSSKEKDLKKPAYESPPKSPPVDLLDQNILHPAADVPVSPSEYGTTAWLVPQTPVIVARYAAPPKKSFRRVPFSIGHIRSALVPVGVNPTIPQSPQPQGLPWAIQPPLVQAPPLPLASYGSNFNPQIPGVGILPQPPLRLPGFTSAPFPVKGGALHVPEALTPIDLQELPTPPVSEGVREKVKPVKTEENESDEEEEEEEASKDKLPGKEVEELESKPEEKLELLGKEKSKEEDDKEEKKEVKKPDKVAVKEKKSMSRMSPQNARWFFGTGWGGGWGNYYEPYEYYDYYDEYDYHYTRPWYYRRR